MREHITKVSPSGERSVLGRGYFCARLPETGSSQLYFMSSQLEPDNGDDLLLEQLPGVAVQQVAQFSIVVHLSPAIASPLAACHVDKEITALSVVVNLRIVAIAIAGVRREGVCFALFDESGVRPDPWLRSVHELQSILFLVLPFHVLLLVGYRVPPDVEQAVSPWAALDEEGAEVEATAILRHYQVDRLGLSVTNRRQ